MSRRDLVFVISGAAALVDEVVWSRLLGRVLGSDALASGLILGVFLFGLGAGAWLFGPRAERAKDPRRLFGLLEAAIGLWAAASPFALAAAGVVSSTPARLAVALAFLLVPTLAMGGTFPVMGRLAIARAADAGSETARFYGANTLGAALGALAAPFLLLPLLGLTGALLAAGLLHAAAGALAQGFQRPTRSAASSAPAPRRAPYRALLLAPLLLGFASLVYEVALVRVVITLTGASVYAFAIVLAVYLLGLGLGSRQAAGWLARAGRGPRLLFLCATLAPLGACVGLLVLRAKLGAPLDAPLANLVLAGATPWKLWLAHTLLAALALLPPALAFGAALPAVVATHVERDPEAARGPLLGRIYAWNTLGSTAGALLGSFVLLPHGPSFAVRVAFAAALTAALPVARGRMLGLATLAGVLAIAQGAALARGPAPETLFHAVGPEASATVTEVQEAGRRVRALRINGKVVASTAPVDLRLQRLLGHVPGILHGEVQTALVIGLGTGMTAGALLDFPSVERLTVVELSPAVRAAALRFAEFNGDLEADARTTIRIGDGRHYLFASESTYDLVTSDPIHPWTRGSADLYALEHFERMAAHLSPGGIASQWLPLYQLSTEDVRTVVATWCAAFPNTAAWLTAYDLALIGWNRDAPLGLAGWQERPLPEPVARSLAEAGIHDTLDVAALQVADDHALRAFAGATPPMVEDRPVLEFRAPKSFLAGYSLEALRWAGRDAFVEELAAEARPRARRFRASLGRFIESAPAGLSEAAHQYGEELMESR
jgi:spermidine synthase